MFCPKCGKQLPDGAKFCPGCGSNIANITGSNTSGLGQTIDNIGDNIGNNIDQAAEEIKEDFRQAGQQFSEAKANAEQHFEKSREKAEQRADDIKKNWREYITAENMEKAMVVGLFMPLAFIIVASFISVIADLVYFVPVVGVIFRVLLFLIRIMFVVGSAVALGSAIYIIVSRPDKCNVWTYISCGLDLLAFVASILIAFVAPAKTVAIIFIVICIIWGIDALSRVLIRNNGIESTPNVGDDLKEYKNMWDRYKQEHPSGPEYEAQRIAADPAASYFDGNGAELLGLLIVTGLISVITCSLATPWMLCKIYKWRKSHTVINGRRLDFVGTGSSLLGHWILWTFLDVVTCGIYSFFEYVALERWEMENTIYADDPNVRGSFDGNSFQFFGYGLISGVLLLFTCGLAAPWTITMIMKWQTRHECIGSDRFYYDGSALGLLGQYLIAALLTVITCGVFYPWATVRINKYIYAHTKVNNGI